MSSKMEWLTPKEIRDLFRPLKEAVRYAQRRGVILVAAAGNFTYPEVSLPAGYPGVISVGATGVDNRIASYSSWGRGIQFMAPGGDFTDLNNDHFQDQIANLSIKPFRSIGSLAKPDSIGVLFFVGTSAAAPHVSGAVALLMSLGLLSGQFFIGLKRLCCLKTEVRITNPTGGYVSVIEQP